MRKIILFLILGGVFFFGYSKLSYAITCSKVTNYDLSYYYQCDGVPVTQLADPVIFGDSITNFSNSNTAASWIYYEGLNDVSIPSSIILPVKKDCGTRSITLLTGIRKTPTDSWIAGIPVLKHGERLWVYLKADILTDKHPEHMMFPDYIGESAGSGIFYWPLLVSCNDGSISHVSGEIVPTNLVNYAQDYYIDPVFSIEGSVFIKSFSDLISSHDDAIQYKNPAAYYKILNRPCYSDQNGNPYALETSLTISSNTQNYDLFAAAGSPTCPVSVNLTINPGIIVSSATTSKAAIWGSQNLPVGSRVKITNKGAVVGINGNGGKGGIAVCNMVVNGRPGSTGGNAISLVAPTIIDNYGRIYSGGGGGGGGGSGPSTSIFYAHDTYGCGLPGCCGLPNCDQTVCTKGANGGDGGGGGYLGQSGLGPTISSNTTYYGGKGGDTDSGTSGFSGESGAKIDWFTTASLGGAGGAAGKSVVTNNFYLCLNGNTATKVKGSIDGLYDMDCEVLQDSPTVTLSASPTKPFFGESSILSWVSKNTETCEANGDWSGIKAVSGTQPVGPITLPKTYDIVCEGVDGTKASSSVSFDGYDCEDGYYWKWASSTQHSILIIDEPDETYGQEIAYCLYNESDPPEGTYIGEEGCIDGRTWCDLADEDCYSICNYYFDGWNCMESCPVYALNTGFYLGTNYSDNSEYAGCECPQDGCYSYPVKDEIDNSVSHYEDNGSCVLDPEVTITYNGNGNTDEVSTVSDNYTRGETIGILSNDHLFTKTDHTFVIWRTNPNPKEGIEYKPGDQFEITQDITLYAQWAGPSSGSSQTYDMECIPSQAGSSGKIYVNRQTKWEATSSSINIPSDAETMWSGENISPIETLSTILNKLYTTVGKKTINATSSWTDIDTGMEYTATCSTSTNVILGGDVIREI